MRIGIFGNCQAGAVAKIFKELLKCDEIVAYKAVHIMTENDKNLFLADLKSLDILVHQPVGSGYGLVSTANIMRNIGNVRSIVFPVLYFSSYFLDMCYLKNSNGKVERGFLSDYHSRIILSAFYHGFGFNEIRGAFYSNNFFKKETLEKDLKVTIANMIKRESTCDIKISDLLKSYKKNNLFFTFNHPTGHILYSVIDRILYLIGYSFMTNEIKKKFTGILRGVHWHSVCSIHKGLELEFNFIPDFYMNNKVYSLDDFYKCSFNFYKNNPSLVKLNHDKVFSKKLFK